MPATDPVFDYSAAAIRARREELGLTREQLAIAVGRSVPAITSWERGDRRPDSRVRLLLARALDVVPRSGFEGARERVQQWVVETRAASNVPSTIEDPSAIADIAHILGSDAA